MRGMHATESQSVRSEYFTHKTIDLLHCQQTSTQYLKANQTRVKQKLTLSLNKVYN